MGRTKKKATEAAEETAPIAAPKGYKYKVGEHNVFNDKIYAEKFAAKRGLTVQEI